MKILIHVTGMFVLGALALALTGAVYESRTESPVPEPRSGGMAGTSGPVGTSGSLTPPFPGLLSGIYSDTSAFVDQIGTDRSAAVSALDAATRLARTLQYAVADDGEMNQLATTVEDTRMALQNGAVERARMSARSASGIAAQPLIMKFRRPQSLDRYVGAVVIAENGAITGRVTGADTDRLLIETGGMPRFLGFLPLGHGDERTLKVEDAVFGAPGYGTNTFVIELGRPAPRGT